MKKYFKVMVMLGILGPLNIYAQVGMPTNNPNPNAVLDLNRTDGTSEKGLLLPKVALKATDNFAPMAAHVAGMKVYNTATDGSGETAVTPGEYNNDGTKWVRVASKDETSNAWNLGGNTNGTIKELGTKDAQPISFITDNTAKMNLSTDGIVGISADTDPSYTLPNSPTANPLNSGFGRLRLMSNSTNYQDAGITISQFKNAGLGSGRDIISGRGTHESPQQSQLGDQLGFVKWTTYNPNHSLPMDLAAQIAASTYSINALGVATGQLSLSSSAGGSLFVNNGVSLGGKGTAKGNLNTTDIYFAGTLGSPFKVQSSATGATFNQLGSNDYTSIQVITANTTVNYTLLKADATNKGRIYILVAAGGGTSGRITLTPASGDKIGLIGSATSTTTTAAVTNIKVISDGVDTWYQLP